MRVALLGLGLIGGSIARALRRNGGAWQVAAWTPSGTGPGDALAAGIIDDAARSPAAAVAGAELVVLAGPPLACLAWIAELAGPLADALRADAVVTDVASTKTAIVDAADQAGLRFVGGHPMAGRETSGFAASTADLFDGRPWVVTPGRRASDDDRRRVERLVTACGARSIVLGASEHDAAVAAVSHLPLVLSAALVEAVAGVGDQAADTVRGRSWSSARELAAGGWESMTRLAKGDPTMGAGILATNAPAVAARLHDARAVIDAWLAALERPAGPDANDLERRLAAVRDRLGEHE